jgi:hypothetical protein
MTAETFHPVQPHVPTAEEMRRRGDQLGKALGDIEDLLMAFTKTFTEDDREGLTPEQAWLIHDFAYSLKTDAGELQRFAGQFDDLAHTGAWERDERPES